MDWEREKAVSFRLGKAEGEQQKAVEAAILLVQKYKTSPETAAKDMNAPLELVLKELSKCNQQ